MKAKKKVNRRQFWEKSANTAAVLAATVVITGPAPRSSASRDKPLSAVILHFGVFHVAL